MDRLRAEVVRAAQRVLGVTGSFDDRSFLGHILKVNDLLPPGSRPEALSASDFQRHAQSRGRIVGIGAALPGDIVLFSCNEGCGAVAPDGLGAGVVVRAYEDRVEFIAYVGSVVRLCYSGGSRPRLPSHPVANVVAVVSLGHSAQARQ